MTTFSGTVAIRAMKAGDFLATIFSGTEAGLIAALAYAGIKGAVKCGPGNVTITSILTVPAGCVLELGSGNYGFSGASGISLGFGSQLLGQGYGSTQMQVGATFTGQAVVFNTTQDGTQQSCMIERIEIYGNRSAGGNPVNGIFIKGLGQPTVIRDCTIFNMAQRGITLEGVSSNAASITYVDNCWVNDCSDHAIVVTGPMGAVTINRTSVEVIPSNKAGIYIDGAAAAANQSGIWIRDTHIEVLPANAIGILLEDSKNVTVENVLFFGSGGTGDLVKITGTAGTNSYNQTLINICSRFNAVLNSVNDVSNGVTYTNEVPFYSTALLRTTSNLQVGGTTDLTGVLTARAATANFGTAGVAHTTKIGQSTTGADGTDLIVNSGNTGATKARLRLMRNSSDRLLMQTDGTNEFIQFTGGFQFGTTAGAQVAFLTSGSKMRIGSSGIATRCLELEGALVIGDGAAILKVLSATASLNFDLTALVTQDLTITVTGAAVGDCVFLGVDNASVTGTIQYTAWVSAVNTVTVRARTAAVGENPASGTFRATVIQH